MINAPPTKPDPLAVALLEKRQPDPNLAVLFEQIPMDEPIAAPVLVARSGFTPREGWLLLAQLVCGKEVHMWKDGHGDHWVSRRRKP
jgi:hypothetical protein